VMLSLSRKKRETVVLKLEDGRLIEVLVLEIRSGQVRLGFLADPKIVIVRKELDMQKDC